MSKTRRMQYDEIDLLTYRMENIEKRLDHMESLILKGNGTNNNMSSELLHMMFDMMKQQVRMVEPPKPTPHVEQSSKDAVTSHAEPTKTNFDNISCMARRRTIV